MPRSVLTSLGEELEQVLLASRDEAARPDLLAGLHGATETGPGAPSLDSALGLERSGSAWTLAALGAGAAGSAMAISMGQRQPSAPAPAAPPASAAPA